MQFQNNSGDVSRRNRFLVLIVAFVVGIGIIFSVIYGLGSTSKKANNKNSNQGEYYDPGSGQTVSNPPNKTPENFGTVTDEPVYLGFAKLIDVGLTQSQVSALKRALFQYSVDHNNSVNEISLTASSITVAPHNRGTNTARDMVSFELVINRGDKLNASMQYFDFNKINLTLNDASGKTIFNSGDLDDTTGGD